MAEYALILVLIAVVAAVMLMWLGGSTNTLFANVRNAFGS